MRYCSNQLIRLQTGRVTDYGTVIVAALLLALLSFDGAAFGPATALLPFSLTGAFPRRHGRGYRTSNHPYPPSEWGVAAASRYPCGWPRPPAPPRMPLPPEEPKRRIR